MAVSFPFRGASGFPGRLAESLRRWLPVLVTLLAVAILIWVLTGLVLRALAPEPTVTASPANTELLSASRQIVSVHPFGLATEGGGSATTTGSAAPVSNLKLLGTVASSGQHPGQALIAAGETPAQALSVGDRNDAIGRLTKVTRDSAEVERNGELIVLTLPQPTGGAARPDNTPSPAGKKQRSSSGSSQ